MILKEAYRYQNYLSNLVSSAEGYLCKKDFITETTQTHNRKKCCKADMPKISYVT